ncbi:MAG TPA: hypothetical protein VHP33_03625 [Polyangiaceae bacterium]|nr:hypothetical protein [Polyangiaceae bacterium]
MLAHSLRGLTAALLAVSLLGAASAHAEEDAATRAAARKLAEDGVAALQNGDAATAVQKLEKAHNMLKAPSVALWSARALAKRGLLVEAAERLREASRLPVSGDAGVQEQAKRDAEKELGELSPRIPSLVIAVSGVGDASVTVTLDGAAIPSDLLGEDRPVNPGPHRLVAKRGADERSLEVTLAEGERKPASLDFGSAAPTPASATGAPTSDSSPSTASSSSGGGNKTLAFVALGAGAAGLVVGGVTGGLALSKKSKLDDDDACRAGQCTYAVESDVKSLRTFRTVSTIGFIAGGVLAATGVVLLVTSGSSQQQGARQRPHVALAVGAGNLQLAGSF